MTQAAAKLGIQQPPLSQQISALEKELGVVLFDRSPRSIRLNSAGRLFLGDAKKVLSEVEKAVLRLQRFDQGNEGSIRVGFTSSAAVNSMVLRIIRTFRERYPLIDLKIEEGANDDIAHMVEQERLDFAFIRTGVEKYTSLHSRCILNEEMVIAVHNSHEFVGRQAPIPFAMLEGQQFVLYRQVPGVGISAALIEVCKKRGVSLRISAETQRIMSAIQMVASGFGITVVPRSMAMMNIENVSYLEFKKGTSFAVPLNIVYRRGISATFLKKFLLICDQCVKTAEA